MNSPSLRLMGACVGLTALVAHTPAQSPANPSPDAGPQRPSAINTGGDPNGPDVIGGSDPAPAASPTAMRAPRMVTPIHSAAPDMGIEYGIWGAGADYKASFHAGMTFVPYLGKDYPHNQPFSWSTRSVKVGNTELVTQQPTPNQGETRFEYDLGNVTEAYDLLVDGLEQTFVIHKAQGRGDLVVQGKIDSLLTAAAVEAAHQELSFVDADGTPIVSYGEAFAVDADGRKVPMTTAYADGVITLSLAAQTLETLTYPIIVDPLLGNIPLRVSNNGSTLNLVMDCVRDDDGFVDNVWYAYSRAVSATDDDLWVQRRNDSWAIATNGPGQSTPAFTDITASWDAFEPQIASVSGANRTITVFTRHFPSTDLRRVRWHSHDYTDYTSNSSYGAIGITGQDQQWRPDVGGTRAFSGGTTAMVVLQSEVGTPFSNSATSDMFMVPIDVDSALGQGSDGPEVLYSNSANIDFERPRINQQCQDGANPLWMVSFQLYNNSIANDDWDVGVVAVDGTGARIAGPAYTDVGNSDHKLGPIVSGLNGRFAMIYSLVPTASVANPKPTGVRGNNLRVRRFDINGASISFENAVDSSLGELGLTTASRRWIPGNIAMDTDSRNHWLVTFSSTASNTGYVALTGYRGGYVMRETVLNSTTDVLIGGLSYDDDNDEFVLQVGDNDAAGNLPVIGDVWRYTTAPAEIMTGTSCSTVNLSWLGAGNQAEHEHQIGNGDVTLVVTGAPANAFHFMVLSLASADRPVVVPGVGPGCRLLVDSRSPDYIGTLDFKIGSSVNWGLQLPENLVADTIYFQDWHTDITGTLFLSSRRLEVQIVE